MGARATILRTLLLLGLALGGCGGKNQGPPVNPARADGGGDATVEVGPGGTGGSGGGGDPQPAGPGSEECARRQCNAGVSDLCCPASCSAASDIDCGGCGNGRLEAGEVCDPAGSCPQSCPQLKCETQRLKSGGTCAAVCVPAGPQSSCMDGDECCPDGCTAANDRDCTSQCGNGTTEPGELCDPLTTCPQTCPMRGCTLLALKDAGTCLARCEESGQETACKSNDGCCPSGCTTTNDSDCGIVCGNGAIEAMESCDPLASCPQSCPAQGCRLRRLVNAGTCTAACIDAGLQTMCQSGDGCCPVGCLSTNDNDCTALCGNGVVETGETCDPIGSCLDQERACLSDGATTRVRSGDPGKCQFRCLESARTCGPADGACPPGCGPTMDRDCPGCGNGVTEPSETCDPVQSCLERQQACVSDQSTVRVPGGDPAACTFTCGETPRPCGPTDGNCPAGCTAAQDADCAGCGNGVLDPGETCDPVAVCDQRAAACVSDASTVRTPEGDPGTCRFTCRESPRVCGAADGMCPQGCGPAMDCDCAGCGNGRVESGETCDPCRPEEVAACVSDAGTVRMPMGSAATCTFTCTATPRGCASGDGFCPAGCTRATDGDCLPGAGEMCSLAERVPCGAGSCVDGRCCVQSCAVCQACTGSGGTCQAIMMGLPDNTPAGACVAPQSCNGQGSCQSPGCDIAVMPGKHDFGSVPVGAASETIPFVVTTTCATTVNPTTSRRDFLVVANGCVGGVAPGKPCTVGVSFRPLTAGSIVGALNVAMGATGAATGGVASATLAGTGQTASLGWKPDRVNFGQVPVGTRSIQNVTLFNQGPAASGALTFTDVAAPFSILQNGCPATGLAAGQTCELALLFMPEKPGQERGQVVARAGGVATTAPLAGVGVGRPRAALTITPTSHAFGTVLVGGKTAPVTFEVTAGIDLEDLSVRSSSSEFVVSDTTCSPKGLAAGMSCKVAVVFAPTVAGDKRAALQASARPSGVFIVAPPLETANSTLTGSGLTRIITQPPRDPPPVIVR